MKEQRTHEQRIAGGSGAEDFPAFAPQRLNTLGGKPAETVCFWDYAQLGIGLIGIIQVNANRQHLLEQLDWRLDVRNGVFRAPWAEARMLDSFTKGERQILVPGNEPIGVR